MVCIGIWSRIWTQSPIITYKVAAALEAQGMVSPFNGAWVTILDKVGGGQKAKRMGRPFVSLELVLTLNALLNSAVPCSLIASLRTNGGSSLFYQQQRL
jgi:hypothetical protein